MSALDTDDYTKEQIGSVSGDDDDFNTNNMDTATNQVTGKIGKALDMNEDSTNERVCLEDTGNRNCWGDGPIFDTAVDERTSSLWYKADDVSGTDDASRQVLFEEGGNVNGQNIYLFDDKIFACTWRSNVEECVSYPTTANEWHHVALVWVSGTTSYLYHDGVQVDDFTGRDLLQHNNPSALGNIAGDTNITDVDGENNDAVKRTYTNHSSPFAGIID
jgi:hypothetical protein